MIFSINLWLFAAALATVAPFSETVLLVFQKLTQQIIDQPSSELKNVHLKTNWILTLAR